MMFSLLLIFTFIVVASALSTSSSTASSSAAQPGKAAFWLLGPPSQIPSSSASASYNTKTLNTQVLPQQLDSLSKDSEVVVVLSSADGRPVLSHSSVIDSIRSSADKATILSSIYHPSIGQKKTTLEQIQSSNTISTNTNSNSNSISLPDFLSILKSKSNNILNNGRVDPYFVQLTGHESEKEGLQEIASSCNGKSKVLMVAVDEPGAMAVAPETRASYSRILAGKSSDLTDGIYYKPEGAEYSIYYADTYLYITPDIFTGIMTGLFFLFTAITGYSCLNGIQGIDNYASKTCPVGKEA